MSTVRCLQGTQAAGKLTCRGGCGDRQRCQRLCAPDSGAQHGRRLHACHASRCCARFIHITTVGMVCSVMSTLQIVYESGASAHEMVTPLSGAAFPLEWFKK